MSGQTKTKKTKSASQKVNMILMSNVLPFRSVTAERTWRPRSVMSLLYRSVARICRLQFMAPEFWDLLPHDACLSAVYVVNIWAKMTNK